MYALENPIQPYAWGSRTAIAELQGRPTPTAEPEAELWMGAHPRAPSFVRSGATAVPLSALIADRPEATLGARVATRFGAELPFLLKVLAAERPLSLQAHPSAEQARAGCAREDAANIPRDAPHRSYRDPHHKPELLCALAPFEVLCGFRAVDHTRALLAALAVPALAPVAEALEASPPRGLHDAFSLIMTLPAPRRRAAVVAVAAACTRHADTCGPWAAECAWIARIAEAYPGDPGVIGSLLLKLMRLAPGEAVFLPAGNLHAYLRGVGIELMANSDNVLRGGLTPKHVDVAELLRVLDFEAPEAAPVAADIDGGVITYDTPAPEFRLSRIALAAGEELELRTNGPEIVLCTEGALGAGTPAVPVPAGDSVFVPASTDRYRLRARRAAVAFRATVGDLG
jgi:mannose-6-phosphate isomerase